MYSTCSSMAIKVHGQGRPVGSLWNSGLWNILYGVVVVVVSLSLFFLVSLTLHTRHACLDGKLHRVGDRWRVFARTCRSTLFTRKTRKPGKLTKSRVNFAACFTQRHRPPCVGFTKKVLRSIVPPDDQIEKHQGLVALLFILLQIVVRNFFFFMQ